MNNSAELHEYMQTISVQFAVKLPKEETETCCVRTLLSEEDERLLKMNLNRNFIIFKGHKEGKRFFKSYFGAKKATLQAVSGYSDMQLSSPAGH